MIANEVVIILSSEAKYVLYKKEHLKKRLKLVSLEPKIAMCYVLCSHRINLKRRNASYPVGQLENRSLIGHNYGRRPVDNLAEWQHPRVALIIAKKKH